MYKIALILVSQVLKARNFPDCNMLRAKKGQGGSCIWNSIWQAKEELKEGFRCVVGNGTEITATKDPWLRVKHNFMVEDDYRYIRRNEKVAESFLPNSKVWNDNKIRGLPMLMQMLFWP